MIGQTVSHFEILERIGQGGMGVVYKARDLKLDRLVALKFLPMHLGADEAARQRFTREAKTASALDHTNVCTVYEIGEAEDGRTFIAMAFCDGETLSARIGRGPLPVEEAVDIASQVARGLAEAHARGIVHRDIKPGNVAITSDGSVLLRDVLKTNPSHAASHFSLSYAYRYGGMLKESTDEGETALNLDANNPSYRSLATTYLYLGEYDRALAVHKLDPDSPWTLAREGQIFLRRGQKKLALERFDRTIEREPESSTGRWAFAMKAHLAGKREEGIAALRRSEDKGMVDGEQRYHFANVHCLLGDAPGCITGLSEAVSRGFFNYPFMLRDSFLDPVRGDPKFQRVLADAKDRHEAFKAKFFTSAGPASRAAG